jgi:hypothetical protein
MLQDVQYCHFINSTLVHSLAYIFFEGDIFMPEHATISLYIYKIVHLVVYLICKE